MGESAFMGVSPDQGPARPKLFDVISPKPGVSLDCTSLDSRPLGLLTHFIYSAEAPKGRSRFCYWEEGRCKSCFDRHVQVWQGYLGVYCHTLYKRIVLCFGKESALVLTEYAKKHGGFHLLRFRCRKSETGPKAALDFQESPRLGETIDMNPFNILPSVAAVLGVSNLPDYRYTARELSDQEVPIG